MSLQRALWLVAAPALRCARAQSTSAKAARKASAKPAAASDPSQSPLTPPPPPGTYRRRVAVGLSGGVDSAVSALLLQRAGWDVVGVYMRNWDGADEAGTGVCSTTADVESAESTARQLGIPLHVADFSRRYWTHVFEPFLEAYSAGAYVTSRRSTVAPVCLALPPYTHTLTHTLA
jgi:tRNA-specific 2-thiouridylase